MEVIRSSANKTYNKLMKSLSAKKSAQRARMFLVEGLSPPRSAIDAGTRRFA